MTKNYRLRSLYDNRDLFLTVLEAGSACMVGFWGEPSSGLQTADFLLHLHIVERGQEVL